MKYIYKNSVIKKISYFIKKKMRQYNLYSNVHELEEQYQIACRNHENSTAFNLRKNVAIFMIINSFVLANLMNSTPEVISLQLVNIIVAFGVLFLDYLFPKLRDSFLFNTRLNIIFIFYFAASITLMTHYGHINRNTLTVNYITIGMLALMVFSRTFPKNIIVGTIIGFSFLVGNIIAKTWVGNEVILLMTSNIVFTAFLGTFLGVYAEQARRREFYLQMQVSDLLHSALPASVVKRKLEQKSNEPIIDKVDSASIMFIDLVNFTKISENLSPEKLVELLDKLYSRFDMLVKHSPAEKIKTIGDSYMVVCGIPDHCENHVDVIANLALEFREAIQRFTFISSFPLSCRIGIHSGPVAAGVIGKNRLQYDIWGDTVNIASRMEASGIEGEIQVSSIIYEKLKTKYNFTHRGLTNIKNKQPINTYILKNPIIKSA